MLYALISNLCMHKRMNIHYDIMLITSHSPMQRFFKEYAYETRFDYTPWYSTNTYKNLMENKWKYLTTKDYVNLLNSSDVTYSCWDSFVYIKRVFFLLDVTQSKTVQAWDENRSPFLYLVEALFDWVVVNIH